MSSWSDAQLHNTGKQQPRDVTHELVVLRNPDEASHKNSASSVEGNYTQLKSIRGPTGNYQQLVYKQDGSKCNDDKKKETTPKESKSGKECEMKTEQSQCKQMEQQPYNRDHRKENKTDAKTSPKKSCAIRIIAAMSVLSLLLATVALVGVVVILVQEYPGGGDQSKQALEAAMLNLQGQNALEEKLLALLKEQNTTSAKIDMFLATLNNMAVTAVKRSEFDQLSTTVESIERTTVSKTVFNELASSSVNKTVFNELALSSVNKTVFDELASSHDSHNSSAQESFSELTHRLNNLSSTVNNLHVKPFLNCHTQIFTSSQTLLNSDTVFTTLFDTPSYYVNRTVSYLNNTNVFLCYHT